MARSALFTFRWTFEGRRLRDTTKKGQNKTANRQAQITQKTLII